MNSQFKKGVLELLTLLSVRKQDMYGYELVKVVSEAVDVSEGTIYPLLKRMTNEKYFDTYLQESSEGPPRKYYSLTVLGHSRLSGLEQEWKDFCRGIDLFINKYERT